MFLSKHAGAGTLDSLRRVSVREKSKTADYVMVDDIDGLVSLVQIGVLEIHVWGSRADLLEQPDRLVFDLDPDPTVRWPRVVESARQIRDFLGDLGLESFVKTTGGKGLHVVVPIRRQADWPEIRQFSQAVAEAVSAADPGRYTLNMLKAKRRRENLPRLSAQCPRRHVGGNVFDAFAARGPRFDAAKVGRTKRPSGRQPLRRLYAAQAAGIATPRSLARVFQSEAIHHLGNT